MENFDEYLSNSKDECSRSMNPNDSSIEKASWIIIEIQNNPEAPSLFLEEILPYHAKRFVETFICVLISNSLLHHQNKNKTNRVKNIF